MKFHLLFDAELKVQLPNFAKDYPGFMEHRYLPKESSSSAIIVTFGEYVVMYAGVGILKMSENTVFFVVKSAELAEGYRAWFSNMWAQSKGDK
jgi:hypothetical protein